MAEYHRGAKIGTRIAELVSRSIIATHNKLAGTKHKLAMAIFHSMSDMISEEAQRVLGPQLETLLSGMEDDSPMRGHIEFLAHEKGQLNALAGTSLTASGILSSIALIMNDILAPSVRAALGANPQLDPDIGTLAQFAALGLYPPGDAITSIGQQGYRTQWAELLIDASRQYPALGELFDMLRRGVIDESLFNQWAQRAGMPEEVYSKIRQLATVTLAPADAALAVLRGNMTTEDGQRKAAESGVTAEDFATLISNTGEPLGLMQLLEAFRRGFIDEDTLKKGILESRVRNEWIPTALQLRYAPMSIADAVDATVQGHMSQSDMAKIAQDNGLEPGQVNTLYLTAGEPLSRTEATQLFNRGQMTEQEFKQALSESRLKNKYIDQAFDLTRTLLEPRLLSDAVRSGAASHDYAVKVAMEHGYNSQDAEILVNHASNDKLRTYMDKVVAAVVTMYEDSAISDADAMKTIQAMGYEPNEADFILQAATYHSNARLVSQAISAIRSKLIGHHIAPADASNYLDGLGVSSQQRDQLLALWNIELAANVRQLTEAQVVKAATDGLITPDDAQTRLVAMGYTATDAALLLDGA